MFSVLKFHLFLFQRPLYRHYYQNTDALMFVIDSSDRGRIEEVHEEIWRFMGDDELSDSVILIMANKQDLPNAMSVTDLTNKLELNKIKDKNWCKLHILHPIYSHGKFSYRYPAIMCPNR